MFTGIIEEIGVVKETRRLGDGQTLRLGLMAGVVTEDLKTGDSLSVDGCCLTVSGLSEAEVVMTVSPETLRLTTLGGVKVGDGVNLERAMRLGDRLGGHWVSGHVDGVGHVRERKKVSDALALRIEAPSEVLRYCVRKGSVAVDGISLTVNDVGEKDFSVMLIAHTAEVTTLGVKGVGAAVNLEGDILGKYVERLLLREPAAPPRIDVEYLRRRDLI